MATAKVLVAGAPGGPQGRFVSAISEVKVRSSGRNPRAQGTVPMDFGRVKIAPDIDLQLFGLEREQVGVVADAVYPGVVGAVLLVDPKDEAGLSKTAQAINELSEREIPTVIATPDGTLSPAGLKRLGDHGKTPVVSCPTMERESVKKVLVALLEAAIEEATGSAA